MKDRARDKASFPKVSYDDRFQQEQTIVRNRDERRSFFLIGSQPSVEWSSGCSGRPEEDEFNIVAKLQDLTRQNL